MIYAFLVFYGLLPGVYSQMMTLPRWWKSFALASNSPKQKWKVVLSVLLEKSIFEPGRVIYWEMGSLHHPVAKDEEGRTDAQVPMKVSVVRQTRPWPGPTTFSHNNGSELNGFL